MDKNRVSVGQLALLYLLLITGGKFLSLPSLLAGDVGHDSWLSMCFSFIWDGICLTFLLWAIKINRNTRLDISTILDKSVTKVVSKIILAIFFVIFVLRTNLLLSSCYEMFSVTFDVNTNWIVYVIPVAVLAFFAIHKGFNAVARTSQLLFSIIFISVIALLVSPLMEAEWTELLPIGEAGWGKIIATSYTRSFWFSDYIFIYFVMDGIKVKKHVFSPILVAFVIGSALAILMDVVFVALFGHLAPNFDMAMSKIGVFSSANSTNGRWDWLTLSVWLISVFIKVIVFIFCAYKCLEKIANKNFVKINWIVAAIVTLTLMLPLFVTTDILLSTVIAWGLIPFTVVQYILPLFMPLLTKVAQRRNPSVEIIDDKAVVDKQSNAPVSKRDKKGELSHE